MLARALFSSTSFLTMQQQTTEALLRAGIAEKDIGVIAVYKQQIKLLAGRLVEYPGVEVLTADKSQGRDKECIILSLTRSNSTGHVRDRFFSA